MEQGSLGSVREVVVNILCSAGVRLDDLGGSFQFYDSVNTNDVIPFYMFYFR